MSPDPALARPFSLRPLVLLALAGLFAGLVFFLTRHNDFPIYYHLDEPTKGGQILHGELNFHHPLLLLDTAKLILRASGLPRTVENAVLSGRLASAIFTALSVVFLTILAGRRGGWMAAAACALLVPAHPLIYELAHYCKEDPALLVGMTLSLLALDCFLARPSWQRAAFLGAACGVATSGKYLGIIMVVIAIPFVFFALRRQTGGRAAVWSAFLGAFFIVIAALNLPFLLHPGALFDGLGYEARIAEVGGALGLSRKIPHDKYIGAYLDNISWPVTLGLIAFAAGLFRKRERRSIDALLLLLPLGYAAMLSFIPKTAERYFLAVSPLLIAAAAIGLVTAAGWLPEKLRRFRPWLALCLVACALVFQIRLTRDTWRAFRTDSRREMAAWIHANLPEKSVICADTRLYLSKAPTWPDGQPGDFDVREMTFVSDFGPLDELRANGVRYIAITRASFSSLMASDDYEPATGLESHYQRRKNFYRQLLAEGKLLKETKKGKVSTLNLKLLLYDIRQPENR